MLKSTVLTVGVIVASTTLCGATSPVSAQCSGSKEKSAAMASGDIVDTAIAAGSFKTLVAAVKAAGLVDALKGEGPLTVFAPTDEAFAKLPAGTVESLLKPENKAKLTAILTYHVVPGRLMASDVVASPAFASLQGQRVDIAMRDGQAMIDNARIVTTDIKTTNGVIHVIDSVIMPSTDSIVQTASNAGTFKTLLAAAKAAGLDSTLANDGPFTVFAPTDEAFAKLPAGTVESLLKPENKDKLAAVLKYHVVSGRVFSPDAVKAGTAATLEGGKISISRSGESVKINGATVVAADIDASNGVIHVIDQVLMPAGKKVSSAK